MLQIGVLPGGKTADYVTHINNCITDVAESYSSFNNLPVTDVQKEMTGHLKNTVTDIVPVNHCVVTALEEDFDI